MTPLLNIKRHAGEKSQDGNAAPIVGTARSFEIEWLDDIVPSTDPAELIDRILPMGPALGVIFGAPKTFKSFIAMLMATCVAANLPFGGMAVQMGAVAYVTSEGINGVRKRAVAYRRTKNIEGNGAPLALIPVMPNLGAGPDDALALQAAIEAAIKPLAVPLRMIVIDTARRAMPGKSENKPEDMSALVNNCDLLAQAFNCLILVVHHSPRSDDDRTSGSNVLDAAADVTISVRRDAGARHATATVKTTKDGEEGTTWVVELKTLEIGTDRTGKTMQGAYVEFASEPSTNGSAKAKGSKLSDAQQRIYDILIDALASEGVAGMAGEAAPASMRAVTRETLKAHCKKKGWWDSTDKDTEKSSRTRLGARLNELAGKRAIGLTAEHVWSATRAT